MKYPEDPANIVFLLVLNTIVRGRGEVSRVMHEPLVAHQGVSLEVGNSLRKASIQPGGCCNMVLSDVVPDSSPIT